MILKKTLALMLVAFFLAGCASATPPPKNIHSMGNDELLRAYYELTDEVAMRDRAAQGALSRGNTFEASMIEMGAADKKQRKVDMRLELQKRGLTP
ncbi:MAG: RNA-binding protein [Desulfobaccales bacterium]